MRARLFSYWASEHPEYNQFAIVSGTVTDEDGNDNYASLVIRNDHPKAEEAVSEFVATIKMFNQKP